jgi:hypothetical protein
MPRDKPCGGDNADRTTNHGLDTSLQYAMPASTQKMMPMPHRADCDVGSTTDTRTASVQQAQLYANTETLIRANVVRKSAAYSADDVKMVSSTTDTTLSRIYATKYAQ